MHGTVQIFKNNNNTFVVIMIFFLIFSSVFLTHTADFCNLKGFRLKFSVCLILPYPSAATPLQAAVCALLSYQWPQLLEVFLGRGTPQLNDRKIQEEVGRLRCTEESKRERERERLLKFCPVFSEKTQADTQVPCPFSTWENRMTQGIGGNDAKFLCWHNKYIFSGTAPASRYPNNIGTRLCKWYQTATNIMVHLEWGYHKG